MNMQFMYCFLAKIKVFQHLNKQKSFLDSFALTMYMYRRFRYWPAIRNVINLVDIPIYILKLWMR